MKYRDFGIYTNDSKVLLIMKTGNKDWIYLVHFYAKDFEKLTNEVVNKTLTNKCLNLDIKCEQVQLFNISKNPNGIDHYGFLGEMENTWWRNEMYSFIENIKSLSIGKEETYNEI